MYQMKNPFLCIVLLLIMKLPVYSSEKPVVINGELNLLDWDYRSEKILSVEGDWDFYWNQLIPPDSVKYHKLQGETIRVPASWNDEESGRAGTGYATYVLTIKNAPDNNLHMRIIHQRAAYTVWANGKQVASNGVASSDKDEYRSEYKPIIFPLGAYSESLQIVIHVANYTHRRGGLAKPIVIGSLEALQQKRSINLGMDLFVSGAVLIIAMYHIIIFLILRREKASLLFGISSFLFAVRLLVVGDIFIKTLLPSIDGEMLIRVEHFIIYTATPIFVLYCHYLFPAAISIKLPRIFMAISFFFVVTSPLLPPPLFAMMIPYYQPILITVIIAVLFLIIKPALKNVRGARVFLGGFIFLAFSLIGDIIVSWEIMPNTSLIPIGILLFILSQSYIISQRFAVAFISVQQLSEELTEKNKTLAKLDQLKDEFLSSTSHELRTPLQGIIGLSESLLADTKTTLSTNSDKAVTLVVNSAKRLSHLINDLLDFSQLKHNNLTLTISSVDICPIISDVTILLGHLYSQKRVRIVHQIPRYTFILGDEERLQQIFFNIIGNACKFTPEGEVSITLLSVDTDEIKISVRDSGIGIPADKIDLIFDKFNRGESAEAKGIEGVGLGLWITRKLIEQHKGSIAVNSTVGEGTEFVLSFPKGEAVVSSDSEVVESVLDQVLPDNSLPALPKQNIRVLIADDDPINLQVISNHLSYENIELATVNSGDAVMEYLATGFKPDLLILDVMMPGLSGFEVLQKIRLTHSHSELPVILVTAKNRNSDLEQGFLYGASDYISKPFFREELVSRVKTHLAIYDGYQILKENITLREQVREQLEKEKELVKLKLRLRETLNVIDDALIVTNDSGKILFYNNRSETVFKNRALKEFAHISTVISNLPDSGARTTMDTLEIISSRLALEEESVTVYIIRELSNNSGIKSEHLIEELNRNKNRLESLKTVVSNITHLKDSGSQQVNEDIVAIDSALDRLLKSITVKDAAAERRVLAVELLSRSISYWCSETGKTKYDLAEESKLWTMNINPDGRRRTQTLDKYLSVESLPKLPKWSKIIKTAEFVLANTALNHPEREEIIVMIEQIRTL